MAIIDRNRSRKVYPSFRAQPRLATSQEIGVDDVSCCDNLLPPVINVEGAVIAEDSLGVRIERRLRQSDIDPDFAIASWAKSNPNGGTLLYRRGDTISSIAGAATYTSGPPSSASVANSYGGSTDAGDVDPGTWTINSPYATATLAGSVTRFGTQYPSPEGADPTMTAELTAISSPFTRLASWTIQWTSDVYYGVSSNAGVTATDVYNAGIQAGFSDSLQTGRGQTRSFSPSTEYIYFLWPNHSQYESGTPTFKDNLTGFVFPTSLIGTTEITRNGVTRSYKIYRSDNLITSPFTVVVT